MDIIPEIFRARINTSPIKLTIALTFQCNSRCKTCNIWKIYKTEPHKFNEELNSVEWKKLFDEFQHIGWIEFTGGEPTLKKGVDEIISYVYNNTTISSGGLTTNSISPERSLNIIKNIINTIPKNKILNIAISLDGINNIHNEIRGIDNNFDKALWEFNEIRQLSKVHKNLFVHFAYTISEFNAGEFSSFYDYLKRFNDISIEDITITHQHFSEYYQINKREIDKYKNCIKNCMIRDVNDYLKIFKTESHKNKNLFIKIKSSFYKYYLKNIPKYLVDSKNMIIPCVAGKYSAYIDPYGNIYPCSQWNNKLGNLKRDNFNNIWRNKTKDIRSIISKKDCPNCWTPCEAQPSWLMNIGLLRGWW